VTQLAEVTERASIPAVPTSPKPIRNAVFGGALGLVLGLVVTGLLEALDRRLRRPDEVAALLDLPVVGAVAEASMGGVPVADIPAEEHVAGMDAFRMLRTNMRFLDVDDPPRTILVTSPLPGEGKTTVSLGIALAAAASGQRTLLVEGDLQRPVHATRLGLEPQPGLTDFLDGAASPQQILQTKEFTDPVAALRTNGAGPEAAASRLICITAGQLTSLSGESLGSKRFAEFLAEVRAVYDLVVVDSAPLLAVAATSEIVPAVDAVVLCVRVGQTTADQALASRDALKRLPTKPTGLVLTGLGKGDREGYYSYAYSYRFAHEGDKVRGRE
jgi:capsular exopolysaccharide synthesis family protein